MYKNIMVPLDGSPLAECVLPHVEMIARACQSPHIWLVRAVEPLSIPYGRELAELKPFQQAAEFETHNQREAEKYLAGVAQGLRQKGFKASTQVVLGRAYEALSQFATANNVDLMVIATHGRSGISRFVWGSVADRLLRSVCVPVLMVRAPGCVPGV